MVLTVTEVLAIGVKEETFSLASKTKLFPLLLKTVQFVMPIFFIKFISVNKISNYEAGKHNEIGL